MSREGKIKVIDLFAGPGGLGEGFAAFSNGSDKHPFKLSLSIEKDPSAHNTLLLRSFFRQFRLDYIPDNYWHYLKGGITREDLFRLHPKQAAAAFAEAKCIELGKTPQDEVKGLIDQRLNGTSKWVLVGGPPCQAYSFVGRARMKSTNHEFEKDERHFLYREYMRIIADHRPPVFVMENVQGMLSAQHSGKNIIQKILSDLQNPDVVISGQSSGLEYRLFSLVERKPSGNYEPKDFLVHAEKYGIPQARHRVLILGIRKQSNWGQPLILDRLRPSTKAFINRTVLFSVILGL